MSDTAPHDSETVIVEMRVSVHTIAAGQTSKTQYGGAEIKRRLLDGEVFHEVESQALAECARLLHIPLPSPTTASDIESSPVTKTAYNVPLSPPPPSKPAQQPLIEQPPSQPSLTPELHQETLIKEAAAELKRLYPSDIEKQKELAALLAHGRKIKELQPGELIDVTERLRAFKSDKQADTYLQQVSRERQKQNQSA